MPWHAPSSSSLVPLALLTSHSDEVTRPLHIFIGIWTGTNFSHGSVDTIRHRNGTISPLSLHLGTLHIRICQLLLLESKDCPMLTGFHSWEFFKQSAMLRFCIFNKWDRFCFSPFPLYPQPHVPVLGVAEDLWCAGLEVCYEQACFGGYYWVAWIYDEGSKDLAETHEV